MSSIKDNLLGKKREKDSDEQQDEELQNKKLQRSKKQKTQQDEEEDNEDDSDSESSDNQPVKRLFGNTQETGFKGGLFGDLNNPETKPKSLFGSSLFSNDQKQPSLFSSDPNKPSIFSNTSNSLFSAGNSLFNFSEINKKQESNDNSEEEGDDNIGKSASPNPYNPEEVKAANDSKFKKIYVKSIDNLYTYNKETKAYVSKGNGFLSIETSEEDNKKYALIMFRNSLGNSLLEGILNKKYNKFNSYVKKFKHVGHFFFLIEDKDKVEGSNAKVPFINEEELKEFQKKYEEAINFL